MTHAADFMIEAIRVAQHIDPKAIDDMAEAIADTECLYVIGLGGSAANASHAANDLRKLCEKDVVCITDNVAELTARANDEGWNTIFTNPLKMEKRPWSLFVFSVGGGANGVSLPITDAIGYAVKQGRPVLGVVGPKGGTAAAVGDHVIKVPVGLDSPWVTPLTEAFQMLILHALVSHPKLQKRATKW